jgi:hypothetical protein
MRIGAPGGGNHGVVMPASGAAVEDVLAYRAMQQRGILGDHADLRTQALLGDGGDILPINRDTTTTRHHRNAAAD